MTNVNNFSIEAIRHLIQKINKGEYKLINYELFNYKGKKLGYVGKNGYLIHRSLVDGKEKKVYAHRLIFAYYYGVEELIKWESINHIDGNKLNNNITNLEGMSLSENSKHQWQIGLAKKGSECTHSKLTEYEVFQIKKLLYLGYQQRIIANYYNVSRSTILNINLGSSWNHIELDLEVSIPKMPKKLDRVSPNRILSNEDIKFIKNSIIHGTYTRKELSEIFEVSYSAIRKHTTYLRPKIQ